METIGTYTVHVPYKDNNGIYRTGLSEERMKDLGLKNEDYSKFYYDERMIYRSKEGISLNEVKRAWLSVHPYFKIFW